MKRFLPFVALLATVAPRALAGTTARDGEVRGVSVLPATNKVEIVIDISGAAQIQDFTLSNPARLVIDLIGTHLSAPAALYDGQNRGGVRNVRYAQFKPGVVRVVIDLDVLKDYQIERATGQVRVRIGTERTGFVAWSSSSVAAVPPRREAERGSGGKVMPAARNTMFGSAFGTTARTDGNAAMVPSSSAAAHPITIVCAVPLFATCRTKRRSLTSLSWVTVQELMTAKSACAGSSTTVAPPSLKAWRTTSVSYWFALHPKVWK